MFWQVVSFPYRFSCNSSVCSYSKLSQGIWERNQLIVRRKEIQDLPVLESVVHCRNMYTNFKRAIKTRSCSAMAAWGLAEALFFFFLLESKIKQPTKSLLLQLEYIRAGTSKSRLIFPEGC